VRGSFALSRVLHFLPQALSTEHSRGQFKAPTCLSSAPPLPQTVSGAFEVFRVFGVRLSSLPLETAFTDCLLKLAHNPQQKLAAQLATQTPARLQELITGQRPLCVPARLSVCLRVRQPRVAFGALRSGRDAGRKARWNCLAATLAASLAASLAATLSGRLADPRQQLAALQPKTVLRWALSQRATVQPRKCTAPTCSALANAQSAREIRSHSHST